MELNTIQELENITKQCIERGVGLGLFVEMPGFEQPELITNPPANLSKKLDYYKATYDEKLNHKHAEGVRIIGYTF
ncbi:hypothetical protein [Bacillus sp. PK3_68]|uniref:hypothetical protein n=1 Tax=Bacillus sp. PK3_68 TaxID=2027408 RepID=UPI000E76BF5F|nr:hypothetical protein [Bacillus sp. PK3_68]RJS60122.1 hypothetical protein CJ483_08640 [Bacillus sp. PK3_68]